MISKKIEVRSLPKPSFSRTKSFFWYRNVMNMVVILPIGLPIHRNYFTSSNKIVIYRKFLMIFKIV
jgi:hypothetical protein